MTVSEAVRRYYASEIFGAMTRDAAPPNFRPFDERVTGASSIKGCRGEGRDLLTIELHEAEGVLRRVRAACGLCGPAMMVAADVVVRFARGQAGNAMRSLDPLGDAALEPLFELLGDEEHAEDAREKFQYALAALQNAARDSQGLPPLPTPDVAIPDQRG